MNNSIRFIIIVAALHAAMLLASCDSGIELCRDVQHPHYTAVKFDYEWGNIDAEDRPDSMFVVANRIINHWKCVMALSTTDLKGNYLHNAPDDLETGTEDGEDVDDPDGGDTVGPDGEQDDTDSMGESGDDVEGNETEDGEDDETEDDEGEGDADGISSVDEFRIKSGYYKLITFTMGAAELKKENIMAYITDDMQDSRFQDFNIEYKTYGKNDKEFKKSISVENWEDYNPYKGYMISDIRPVYFDTTTVMEIPANIVKEHKFRPLPVTQSIDIRFEIKKDMGKVNFKIDSVWAEISGVPQRINLSRGYLDITETCKMMFRCDCCVAGESGKSDNLYNRNNVECRAVIDVPSIVSSTSRDMVTGPGIMQVLIYASTGDGEYKKFQGKINLYNTLMKSNLYRKTEDGKHAVRNGISGKLDIKVNLVINGRDILESPDNNGGIDRWLPCDGDFNMDI
ncbi:hypothetical protein [Xylanibacter muris]|uniref:DUF5119 domain-containing protein n=1 Tax=Xylanibacter muris TaxID=2736290 RepID=A0ABX2AMT7_9BACT|nr:hypothetical protein [Xylanibacter muris]NPD92508.1 hypothetical protein [Xylanibacter muris]